jgi:hypothetical protein
MTIVIGTTKTIPGKLRMNPDDIKPVEYNWKSTTAFDDQFSYGIQAQEISDFLPEATYEFYNTEPNAISCWAGGCEMLRVSNDGFYVRGQKVPADDKEAETVYNAFKQFLTWAELNRR